MMRITARFAQEWNTWGTVDSAAERRAMFLAACESVDVDPTTKWTSAQALVFVTDSQAAADEILSGPAGVRSIAGTPDSLVEQLAAYEANGFDEFIIPDWNHGDSPATRRETLERIKADVVDHM